MDHKDWQWTDAVARVGVACCRDGSMGVAGVKAPVNNQISDVNYSIVSHCPQCRWAAYLSSDQSETSADLASRTYLQPSTVDHNSLINARTCLLWARPEVSLASLMHTQLFTVLECCCGHQEFVVFAHQQHGH